MDRKYSNAIKLAEYMFFCLPIEWREKNRIYNCESDIYQYYFNDGYICGMCGEVVDICGGRGGVKSHLTEKHPEWIDAYIINRVKESKCKMVLDLLADMVPVRGRRKVAEEYDWHFCLLCGMPEYKDDYLAHIVLKHPGWISAFWITEKREKYKRKLRTYPLKPWKDPQSLFCSPNLKNIINKEPLHGDECRDSARNNA